MSNKISSNYVYDGLIGSGTALALNRQQAITGDNNGQDIWISDAWPQWVKVTNLAWPGSQRESYRYAPALRPIESSLTSDTRQGPSHRCEISY